MAKVLQYLAIIREAIRTLFPRAPALADSLQGPSRLRFEYVRFPSGWVIRYCIKGGWISRASRHPWQICGRESFFKRQPTAEEWREFWRTVESLRIWNWKPSYFKPPQSLPYVIDGESWRFSCRFGQRRVKSSGGKYYPKLWRPQETDSRHDSIALLEAALDTLLLPSPRAWAAELRNPEREINPDLDASTVEAEDDEFNH